jgi:hypothetical protein
MLRALIRLLALSFALLAPVASRAAGADGHGPSLPPVIRAGEAIELRWRVADTGIEELELEISVDGGPWRRISPELPGLARRYVWRVPEMAAERARIRLRVGTEHGERDLPPSEAFRIVPSGVSARPLTPREMTGTAPLPSALASVPPSLHADAESEPIESAPRGPLALRPAPAFHTAPSHAAAPPAPMLGDSAGRTRRYPLRN